MADALSLRAGYAVTVAAQAPQARRKEESEGGATGSYPNATQERREDREGGFDPTDAL